MVRLPGPDFPTDAIITTQRAEIAGAYATGRGTVRARARYVREKTAPGAAADIVITGLPYQVSPAKVLEQIASQMQARKLPMLSDIRDESDHENPTRLVLTPRSNRVDADRLMMHLFATTDLERTYRLNFNVIGCDRRPRVYSLKELLAEWLEFRTETVRRRLSFRLERIRRRLHIVDGLLVAYRNLDEVIRIIREEDAPKQKLMAAFELSDRAGDGDPRPCACASSLAWRRRSLEAEKRDLGDEASGLEATLGSEALMRELIEGEIVADAEKYGDERRTEIGEVPEAAAFSERDLLSTEPVTVILSEKGWVRAAKGHDIEARELSYRTGDAFLAAARGQEQRYVRLPRLHRAGLSRSPSHTLPSARGQGETVDTGGSRPRTARASWAWFSPTMACPCCWRAMPATASSRRLAGWFPKGRAGKAVLNVPKGAAALRPVAADGAVYVAAATSTGHLLVFSFEDVPALGRGKGQKLNRHPPEGGRGRPERVVAGRSPRSANATSSLCAPARAIRPCAARTWATIWVRARSAAVYCRGAFKGSTISRRPETRGAPDRPGARSAPRARHRCR